MVNSREVVLPLERTTAPYQKHEKIFRSGSFCNILTINALFWLENCGRSSYSTSTLQTAESFTKVSKISSFSNCQWLFISKKAVLALFNSFGETEQGLLRLKKLWTKWIYSGLLEIWAICSPLYCYFWKYGKQEVVPVSLVRKL